MMKKGFTLVELMVAVAVFSIVMVVATSALLNVIDANLKAQAIKTAINNVNFALESISKDARVGTDYSCLSNGEYVDTCLTNGEGIKYRSPRADVDGSGKRGFAYYNYNDITKRIDFCLEKAGNPCSDSSLANFSPITSGDLEITSMEFYVLNDDNTTAEIEQPRIILTLSAITAGGKEKVRTAFDLQTSVSQRTRINHSQEDEGH
jgi:prepilin-type N-terminal cleavage/methylation domain-containing protein